MNADELIESYVAEVVSLLSRRQRQDVAIELRLLLKEELQAKADAAQCTADAAMTLELLHAFGRPAEVAARYRPPLVIIDPADGRSFLRAAVIGVAIICILGLLAQIRQPIDSGRDVLTVLGRWWVGSGLAALWWPGILVVCYGVTAWIRRRWPQSLDWKPRIVDRDRVNRLAMVIGLLAIAGGLFVLIEPRWLLDALFGGRAAAVAYEAFTYTETFRRGPAPWLLLFVALTVVPRLFAIVRGRWSIAIRRIDIALSLIICGLLVWTVLAGNVFVADTSDRFVKICLGLIIVLALVDVCFKFYRRGRPGRVPDDFIKVSAR